MWSNRKQLSSSYACIMQPINNMLLTFFFLLEMLWMSQIITPQTNQTQPKRCYTYFKTSLTTNIYPTYMFFFDLYDTNLIHTWWMFYCCCIFFWLNSNIYKVCVWFRDCNTQKHVCILSDACLSWFLLGH